MALALTTQRSRKVVVYWQGPVQPYVLKMVESVRRHVDLPLIQCTDLTTPNIGADAVVRRPARGLGRTKFEHLAALSGELIVLDADVLVQRDVQEVFESGFDVALTPRDRQGERYNAGVIFSRCPDFFLDCLKYIGDGGFSSEQTALNELLLGPHRFRVLDLESDVYNWTPSQRCGQNDRAAIVHFKGARKKQMMSWQGSNGANSRFHNAF